MTVAPITGRAVGDDAEPAQRDGGSAVNGAEADQPVTEPTVPASATPAREPLPTAFSLGGWPERTVFWLSSALVALAVFIPSLPPLVDYPQHLGIAAIMRRLLDPSAPEHRAFEVDLYSYNTLFQFLVSWLGVVMPVESAGKLAVALALFTVVAGLVWLLAELGRPRWYAAFAVPALFSFAVGWGFINHALGVGLAMLGLATVARSIRRPSLVDFAATLAIGFVSAFCHVLGMLLFCLLAASITPELAFRAGRATAGSLPWRVFVGGRNAFLALLPLLGGAYWCIWVFRRQYSQDPDSYTAGNEGVMPTFWEKLTGFAAYTTGVFRDGTDKVLVLMAVVLMLAIVALAFTTRGDRRAEGVAPSAFPRGWSGPLLLPLLVCVISYFRVPMVLFGTHLVFPRFGQIVVLAAILALPVLSALWATRLRWAALGLASLTAVDLVVHMAGHAAEVRDVSALIDRLPPEQRVAAVVYDQDSGYFSQGSLVHLAGYYTARKGGQWAFSFARFRSLPLDFRPRSQPAWPKVGWEFQPADYNVRCKYARFFSLLIVAAPNSLANGSEADVRKLVFRADARDPHIRFVAREGRFWAFDTDGVETDGTF